MATADEQQQPAAQVDVPAQTKPATPPTPMSLSGFPNMTQYKRRPSCLPTRPKVKKFVKTPSSGHKDVEPPSLLLVQHSLATYINGKGIQRPKSAYVKKKTEFHDEEGRMLLNGSGGGRYAGEIFGGAPHGKGEHWIRCKGDHSIYRGEWEFGKKTGYGNVLYTNGQEYRGELMDGEHNGWGSLRYKNGNVYDGEWFKGRRHGQGSLYYENGNWYDGGWTKDAREGWGVFYWPQSRRKFEGEWVVNNPFSGCYSPMTPQEYEMLQQRNLELTPPSLQVVEKGVPDDNLQLLLTQLRHPLQVNYGSVTAVRRLKNDKLHPSKLFKTQVERRIALSMEELEALKHAYQYIAPGYLRRTKLLAVHLRRLLVIARIDPDLPQGQKLLAHLEQCALESAKRNSCETIAFTFNDFIFSILRFQSPVNE